MAAQYGAHEIMEVHEVLSSEINGINTMQLYRQHVRDTQLAQIVDKHLQFAVQGYNTLVQTVQNKGMQSAVPYRAPKSTAPTYGLHQPAPASPAMSVNAVDDRDVACAMLDIHKTGANKKMLASLECADPQLRRTLQQGAVNCSEQAYEIWQYMNQQGYYQVPTMKDMTTQTMINSYQPMSGTFPITHTAPYGTTEMYPGTYVSQTQQPTYSSQTSTGALSGISAPDYSVGTYTSPTAHVPVSSPLSSQAQHPRNK